MFRLSQLLDTYLQWLSKAFNAKWLIVLFSFHDSRKKKQLNDQFTNSTFQQPFQLQTSRDMLDIILRNLQSLFGMLVLKIKIMNEWISDWLRLTDCMIDWLADWLVDWLTNWLTGWLADWLTVSLIDWPIGWLTDRQTDWETRTFTVNYLQPFQKVYHNTPSFSPSWVS